jgi:hypothetical protein
VPNMTSSEWPHSTGSSARPDDGIYVPPARRSRWSEPWVRWTTLGIAGTLLLGIVGAALFFSPPSRDYVEVYITDAPYPFEKVQLHVGGVYVGEQGYPLRVHESQFDILQYRGTDRALKLASGDVPRGPHGALAVVFTQAQGYFAGQWFPIEIPHKMLMITGGLDLNSRESAVLLDLDMEKSLVLTATGFSFRPYVTNLYTHDFTKERPEGDSHRPDLSYNGFTDPPRTDPGQDLRDVPPNFPQPSSPAPTTTTACIQECGTQQPPTTTTPEPEGPLGPNPFQGDPNINCHELHGSDHSDTPEQKIDKAGKLALCLANQLAYRQYESLNDNMTWIVRLVNTGVPIPYRAAAESLPPQGVLTIPTSLTAGLGGSQVTSNPAARITLDPVTKSVLNRDQLQAAAQMTAAHGGVPLFAYTMAPAIAVQMSPTAAWDLSQEEMVEWVEFAGAPGQVHNLLSTQTNSRWKALQEQNGPLNHFLLPYNGRGVGVGVIDVGVDGTHPDLAFDVLGVRQTVGNPLVIYENILPLSTLNHVGRVPNTDSVSGHGTLVAGLIFGQPSGLVGSAQHGFAPGAKGFVCSAGVGMTLLQLTACMDRLVYLKAFPANAADPPILVVSNSWGTSPDAVTTNSILYQQVNQLVDLGVTVVFSAGNSGGDGTTASTNPLCWHPREGVICVGGYEDSDLYDRSRANIYWASSRGKIDQPGTWPDVCGAATRLRSTYPIQLALSTAPYATYSGTSMAAPIVASAVALMQQARMDAGKAPLAPSDVERILEQTAYKFPSGGPYLSSADARYNGAGYMCGHGMLDIQAAVNTALAAP